MTVARTDDFRSGIHAMRLGAPAAADHFQRCVEREPDSPLAALARIVCIPGSPGEVRHVPPPRNRDEENVVRAVHATMRNPLDRLEPAIGYLRENPDDEFVSTVLLRRLYTEDLTSRETVLQEALTVAAGPAWWLAAVQAFSAAERREGDTARELADRALRLEPGCWYAAHAKVHIAELADSTDAAFVDEWLRNFVVIDPLTEHLSWHGVLGEIENLSASASLVRWASLVTTSSKITLDSFVDGALLLWRLTCDDRGATGLADLQQRLLGVQPAVRSIALQASNWQAWIACVILHSLTARVADVPEPPLDIPASEPLASLAVDVQASIRSVAAGAGLTEAERQALHHFGTQAGLSRPRIRLLAADEDGSHR